MRFRQYVSKASDAEMKKRAKSRKTVEKLNAVKKATDAMLDASDSNTANKKLAEAKAKMDRNKPRSRMKWRKRTKM